MFGGDILRLVVGSILICSSSFFDSGKVAIKSEESQQIVPDVETSQDSFTVPLAVAKKKPRGLQNAKNTIQRHQMFVIKR